MPLRDRDVSRHRPELMWLQIVANSSYQCTVLESANLDHILTMSERILTMLVRGGMGEQLDESVSTCATIAPRYADEAVTWDGF
jgi:hypothetical protein